MRRILVSRLSDGVNVISAEEAHHVRDVLRMEAGEEVELFTAGGQSAVGRLDEVSASRVTARVGEIRERRRAFHLTVASAVPKAARADWMIEKLSELGVARFVPLMTARSIVHPEGKNKIDRWQRLAAESAKQSHRNDVMTITPLLKLSQLLDQLQGPAAFLSTNPSAQPLPSILNPQLSSLTLLIGPEGGWTPEEEHLMQQRTLTPLALGRTILRVETAAMAAAAVVATLLNT